MPITSSFAKWYGDQCLPDVLLKTGASHVESDRERFTLFGEVFAQLPCCLDQNRVLFIDNRLAQAHAARAVVFPQYRHQSLVACDQLQLSDRRFDRLTGEIHSCTLSVMFPSAAQRCCAA